MQTRPKRRIEEWGKREVEYYNISSTDGDDWMDNLADEPAVIVGVDIDVHERTDYTRYHWEQPLGICQWALSSAPYHPIMQEIARRVVNNTEYVFQKAEESEETDPKAALEVLHWTGPVAFTDSVLS
jgi:alpha 1,6-mannosyltransferase